MKFISRSMFALGALACVGLAGAQSYDLFMAETPGGFLGGKQPLTEDFSAFK